MTENDRIRQAGEYLANEYLARRPLDLMTGDLAPRSEDEAYAVQRDFLGRLAESFGPVAGYKIAYTNAIMRERSGVASPCSGLILSRRVHDSPASLNYSDYFRLGIECEVAVHIGTDLPASGAPYTRDRVSESIAWLATSFELVDGRPAADADGQAPELKAIVTNISNGGAVLGAPVTDWSGIDLAASHGQMLVNGEVIGEGFGRDVMGHPVEPVAWLANNLARSGMGLTAGTTVLTGSFAPPYMLNAGDTATVSIEGLGEAHLVVS